MDNIENIIKNLPEKARCFKFFWNRTTKSVNEELKKIGTITKTERLKLRQHFFVKEVEENMNKNPHGASHFLAGVFGESYCSECDKIIKE